MPRKQLRPSRQLRFLAAAVLIAGCGLQSGWARDLTLTLPKHSQLTPVQRLNREGVDAVRKHEYEKAEALFYKAYLFDPADPFTLNNLGYISELQGHLDRAQKFYQLATEQGGDAYIASSNAKDLEGKPMRDVFADVKDMPMQVNHLNVEAIELLSENRNAEAEATLQKALTLDPKNVFTLNNLGVADEALGNYLDALKYYNQAAAQRSTEPIVVTLKRSTRGKPVSEVAADSAKLLKERIGNADNANIQAALLTVRGVSATNRNDWSEAKQDFLQAYSLDPKSAFSLNNLGYIAEREGDLETAEFYYAKARNADDANARVGLATQPTAEGQQLVAVATTSNEKVDDKIDEDNQARRERGGPVLLKHRDGTPVTAPAATPAKPTAESTPDQQPSSPAAQPASPTTQPAATTPAAQPAQ